MKLREFINDLLEREGSDLNSTLMLDILRMLVVFNGVSWKSELYRDLERFYRFAGKAMVEDYSSIDRALIDLKSKGLITIEDKVRGEVLSRETYVDQLIKVVDYPSLKKSLMRDRLLLKYLYDRHRQIIESFSKRNP